VLPVGDSYGSSFLRGSSVTITGLNAYNNSYTASSVGAFFSSWKSCIVEKTNIDYVKPERKLLN
jgi:hypothetical protein